MAKPKSKENPMLQFRRCHLCGCVNEIETTQEGLKEGHSCVGCGKHLAPFYFFDESELKGISDTAFVMSLRREAVGYQPLWGFSAIW